MPPVLRWWSVEPGVGDVSPAITRLVEAHRTRTPDSAAEYDDTDRSAADGGARRRRLQAWSWWSGYSWSTYWNSIPAVNIPSLTPHVAPAGAVLLARLESLNFVPFLRSPGGGTGQTAQWAVTLPLDVGSASTSTLDVIPVFIRVTARSAVSGAPIHVRDSTLRYLLPRGSAGFDAHAACNTWADAQPAPSSWTYALPSCPQNLNQISPAVWAPDYGCVVTLAPGAPTPAGTANCWDRSGRGNGLNESSASACWRSLVPAANGAGAQCCFDGSGALIQRGTGSGTDERASGGASVVEHLFVDDLPFATCCKLSPVMTDCDRYYPQRPSAPSGVARGASFGEPHFNTFDGTGYTFNGVGDYWCVCVCA